MNCDKTRDILNSILDGEECPSDHEAMEHLRECSECQAWHESTIGALALVRSSRQPPIPDIAAMVSLKLPPHHHAASRSDRAQRYLLLAVLGSVVLVGIVAAVVVSTVIVHLLAVGGVASAVDCGRAAVSAVVGLMAAGRALATISEHVLRGIVLAASGLGPVVLWMVALNLTLILVAVLMWRRRSDPSSACFI